MLDNINRLREPAAWTVIAVTAVSIILAVVRFALAIGSGAPLPTAAQDASLQAMSLTLAAVVVALVWVCVFHDPTPNAAGVTHAAAWVVTLGTIVTILGSLIGLTASAGTVAMILEFLGGLLDVVLKFGAAAILWLIHRGLRAGRISIKQEPAPAAIEEAKGPATTWTADTASGAVWTSASAAAEGAEPSGQGRAAAAGWQVVPKAIEPDAATPAPTNPADRWAVPPRTDPTQSQ